MRIVLAVVFAMELAAQTKDADTRTIQGLSLSVTDPQVGADANDRRAVDLNCTTNSTTSNPNFSDENCVQHLHTINNGQNLYGGGTNAKKTFIGFSFTTNAKGSGQRFNTSRTMNCFGIGDCFQTSDVVQYATHPIQGDEGTGFTSVSYLRQQESLVKTTINGTPTITACNTTLTQNVIASRTAQAVTVASGSGCNVNDWVNVGRAAASSGPNSIAVKLTAVGAGSLTGVFTANYSSGTSVEPAVVMNVSSSSNFGQDRILVNMTASPYTTGTVASISGGGFVGAGTSWANNMISGDAINPGCISLTADDYTGAPFGSGASTLRSWYQISTIASSTSLGIFTTSTAGDAGYHGLGPGDGTYTVRPCAKVLYINNNQIVIEANNFTWTNGDSVELSIPPFPDVTAFHYYIANYTPGGAGVRSFLDVRNQGARTIGTGIYLSSIMQTGGGADTWAWGNGFQIQGAKVGLTIGNTLGSSIYLTPPIAGTTAKISWGGDGPSGTSNRFIGPTVGGDGSDAGGLQLCSGSGGGCFSFPASNGAGQNGNVGTKVGIPASAGANCSLGMWAASSTFHYDCIATNTWVRSTAATW